VQGTGIVPIGEPSYVNPRAKIGLWHGARERGETGVEAAEGCIAFSVFEVPAVPDFSSHRFPDLAQLDEAQRIKRVGERQNQFLAALHSLGPHFAISLRYFYRRPAQGEGRIRLFLIGRSYGTTESEAVRGVHRFRELLQRTFPSEYRLIDLQTKDKEVTDGILSLSGVTSIAEIIKPEQVFPAWHDPAICGFSFYYFPMPFASTDNDMVEFCHALINDMHCRAVVVDICLIPTVPLTDIERTELETWVRLCERWSRDQRIQVGGGLYSQPTTIEIVADPYAQEARKAYNDLLQRYGSPQSRCFLYAFRALWAEDAPPEHVASALASFALAPNSGYQLCLISRHHPAFQRALNAARFCYVTPAVCNERIWQYPESPETLRRLHRMVDVKEAAGFFRLPIAGRHGCPGIPLDTGLIQPTEVALSRRGIKVGSFIEGHRITADEAVFTPEDLTKHCLIVGTPGSGKTTLCFSLLTQLWEQWRIPFIVLEPAKTEYRALKQLPHFRDDLLIFTVGNERISPFRFNPFEILDGVSVSEHISALNACFSGAFSLWDPLPMIIDQAIREIYADKNWSEYGVGGEDPNLEPPTMEDLYSRALIVAERKSYRGDVVGNIRGALETRLGSLLRGPKGRCFNTRRSVPIDSLMRQPIILELDALNDEEKALMMMFILMLVREYAKANRKSGSPLSHVVLVEEAHNVIGRGEGRAISEHRANPKEVAIRFFTRMLAEMRALGEGIITVDQLPTAIAPEAIKQTNIKITHRLVAADDRKELGATMVFDDGQFQQAAVLPPGQSFVFMEGWARSRLVAESNFKEQNHVDTPPDDQTVREWMMSFQERDDVRDAYLPYPDCSWYCRVCNRRIREQSERLVECKWPIIEKALVDEQRLSSPPPPVVIASAYFFSGFEAPTDDKVRWGCAYVHFRERIEKRLSKRDR
jgi:hypothetical protein